MKRSWFVASVLCASVVLQAQAQSGLREAAQAAGAAWMAHDAAGLIQSESVTIRLRGGSQGPSPIQSTQAVRLISQYLAPASEIGFDLRTVREAGPDRGYAEARRRYVVRGTSDELSETVFLGFRFSGGHWRLVDIRTNP
jgi:hypothetical protein